MNAEAVGPADAPLAGAAQGGALDALCLAAADPGLDIEALLEQECAAQRRAATCLRHLYRAQRKQRVLAAIERMKGAGILRVGGAILDMMISGVAGALGGLGGVGGKTAAGVLGGVRGLNPGELMAQGYDRKAKQAQAEGEERSDRAKDVEAWLASARELEKRMVDRLDALQRAAHDGRMAAMRG